MYAKKQLIVFFDKFRRFGQDEKFDAGGYSECVTTGAGDELTIDKI